MARLNEVGAKARSGEPITYIVTQSSQSPDVNICDLAFFRALGCAVQKARRADSDTFDTDKLAADVLHEYHKYPARELAKMWEYLKYVHRQIIKIGGGNWYDQHRPIDEKHAAEKRIADLFGDA